MQPPVLCPRSIITTYFLGLVLRQNYIIWMLGHTSLSHGPLVSVFIRIIPIISSIPTFIYYDSMEYPVSSRWSISTPRRWKNYAIVCDSFILTWEWLSAQNKKFNIRPIVRLIIHHLICMNSSINDANIQFLVSLNLPPDCRACYYG